MKPNIIAIAALAALTITFASGALAQFEAYETSPLGVGVTMFRPSGSELKKINSTWIGATLQWHMKRDEMQRPTAVLSIGWLSADKANDSRANFIPLKFSVIKRFGDGESCWFVSGGIDTYLAHFARVEHIPDTSFLGYHDDWVSDNATKLGYNMAFGREFGSGWFFEAKRDTIAMVSHKTGGKVDFSGWSITVGSRLAY